MSIGVGVSEQAGLNEGRDGMWDKNKRVVDVDRCREWSFNDARELCRVLRREGNGC